MPGKFRLTLFHSGLLKKRIAIPRIYLSDGRINISRENDKLNIAAAFSNGKKDTVPIAAKPKKPWDISFAAADLSGIVFRMEDPVSGISINQRVADIKIRMNSMSLPEHNVLIKSLQIAGATGTIKNRSA